MYKATSTCPPSTAASNNLSTNLLYLFADSLTKLYPLRFLIVASKLDSASASRCSNISSLVCILRMDIRVLPLCRSGVHQQLPCSSSLTPNTGESSVPKCSTQYLLSL